MEQYKAVRQNGSIFNAMVLKNKGTNKVHYLSSIKIGECYLFDSTSTPHSSVRIPGQSPDGRKSIEVRFAVLEPRK
jgi:hypothetical protein